MHRMHLAVLLALIAVASGSGDFSEESDNGEFSEKKCHCNQVYTNGSSYPCLNDLCITYTFAPKDKCPDLKTVRYAAKPGCICKKGYALLRAGECVRIGSRRCPAVADKSYCRIYNASPCCPDPYQVYVTNEVISPCQHDFCVTYLSGDGSRCYDGRLAKPAPGDGCKCKEGYALIADNRCGKAGSCACPAIADRRDPRFFSNYECQDL